MKSVLIDFFFVFYPFIHFPQTTQTHTHIVFRK